MNRRMNPGRESVLCLPVGQRVLIALSIIMWVPTLGFALYRDKPFDQLATYLPTIVATAIPLIIAFILGGVQLLRRKFGIAELSQDHAAHSA